MGVGGILIAAFAGAVDSPGLRISGMTFVGSRGDQSELVVRADTAYFQPDSDLADLQVVRAEFSDEKKGESFRLKCDRAELDVETNNFIATGNVTGLTGDGQRYSAPWVRYRHEDSLLETDSPVTVTQDGRTLRGDGFRYHIEEQRFELLGNVVMEPEH